MGKDILGCQLVIGDIILFHLKKKDQMVPGKVVEFIKGDFMGIERGYFLRSGEIAFFKEPEITVEFSTQVIRVDSFKAPVAV